MTYPRKWEDITDDKHAGCSRLKIHGGWLVVAWANNCAQENILFIPDSHHKWELEEKGA